MTVILPVQIRVEEIHLTLFEAEQTLGYAHSLFVSLIRSR
jgi:hypothetical protein